MNILGDSIWSKTGTSKKSKLNVGANNHLAMHFINNKRFVWETISFIEIFLPKGMKSTTDLCLDRRFSPWRAHSLSTFSSHFFHRIHIYVCHGQATCVLWHCYVYIDRYKNHTYMDEMAWPWSEQQQCQQAIRLSRVMGHKKPTNLSMAEREFNTRTDTHTFGQALYQSEYVFAIIIKWNLRRIIVRLNGCCCYFSNSFNHCSAIAIDDNIEIAYLILTLFMHFPSNWQLVECAVCILCVFMKWSACCACRMSIKRVFVRA